jgi:hypothetical protein
VRPRLGLQQYLTFNTKGRRGELDKKNKHHDENKAKE